MSDITQNTVIAPTPAQPAAPDTGYEGAIRRLATDPAAGGSGNAVAAPKIVIEDPEQPFDITQLRSGRETVSKLQRQAALAARQSQQIAQELNQARSELQSYRDEQRRADLENRLRQAPPHERLRIKEEALQEEFDEKRRAIDMREQLQRDVGELQRWGQYYANDPNIQLPPPVLNQINRMAAQVTRNPGEFHQFREQAVTHFVRWRAAQAQNGSPQNNMGQYGVRPTPVVSPAGTSGASADLVSTFLSGNFDTLRSKLNIYD